MWWVLIRIACDSNEYPCFYRELTKIILAISPSTHLNCSIESKLTWFLPFLVLFERPHDKTNKMACAPSKDSDQPGHPSSLVRVFTVRMKKPWVLSYHWAHREDLSDWADAQADLSLCWAHSHFVGFVMRWLIQMKVLLFFRFSGYLKQILFFWLVFSLILLMLSRVNR